MPAGRPRGPPSPPFQPGGAATSGQAGARPAAPSRAPARAECVAAPAGGYFEREGNGPASVFRLFPGPRPSSPGPRLPAEWGGGVSRGEGKRAAAIRLGPRPRPGRRPALVRTCALGRGRTAGLLIARLAPAAAPGRPLPARPSSGEHRRPGHTLLSGGLGPHWIAPQCTSGQSPSSISLPVNWG